MSLVPTPPDNATATQRGLLSEVAQMIGGVKTFVAVIVASAGVQLSALFNTNGGAAADVMLKLGTTRTDATGIDAAAKVASLRTGIGTGGTEVEKGYFLPDGTYSLAGGSVQFGTLVYGRGSWIFGNVNGGVGWMTSNFGAYLFQSPGNGQIFASHQFNGTTFSGSGYYGQASAGTNIAGNNGTTASDVGVKAGFTTADASLNSAAKPFSVRSGIGATEVEKFYVDKSGNIHMPVGGGQGRYCGSSGGSVYFNAESGQASVAFFTALQTLDNNGWTLSLSSNNKARWTLGGRFDQAGTDRSANVGNDTQNNPSGINTLQAGTTSVTITNSLVPNPATTKIRLNLSWRGDPGARWWWTQNNGSFTINVSAAPASNVSFDWEICGLL